MKAWRVEQITESGDMHLADLPTPQPGAGQYLVRVEAAGVNFLDTLMIRGRYQKKPPLPFTPGVECAGTILAAGEGCKLAPGRRVLGSVEGGGFAECALMPARAALEVPEGMAAAEALTLLGVNYPTSYYALHDRAGLRAGETVLVHAAAGGVGSAAVQLAKAAGARVIATAGSAEKLEVCRRLGADEALSYAEGDWVEAVRGLTGGRGVDVIYDPVGGEVGEQSLRVLAWRGRYLVIGFAAGGIPKLPANRLLLMNAAALGVFWGEVLNREPATAEAVRAALVSLYRRGAVPPLIGGRYTLAEAPAALAALAGRATVGKLVLEP
ncbi:MAG TPA: NADPH:quinone oxidoreductase family protein [Acetobacteraceae bacterium]|nr:NADPH:quinone oxidoreductase family protein [Acetobacteraceae bacterium]